MRNSYKLAWEGAEALKRHCHHVISSLGAAAPPEAFLFRGNAYYALGAPYFALADYNNAAAVLSISSHEHQDKCTRAVQHFPATQVGTYPSADSHLHIFVKPMLSKSCEVRQLSPQLGRGVVATDHLRDHTVVVYASEPWLTYPTEDGRCAMCARPLSERVFSCVNPNCHEEYCSRECRTSALSLYHAPVCTNTAFQSIELDLYAQLQAAQKAANRTNQNAAAAQLLALRVISTAVHVQVVPSAMGELRILSGRLTFSPRTLCGSTLHLYERVSQALGTVTIVPYEEFISVLARVTANCFQREASVELNLPRAMLNHSCAANVAEDGQSGEMVTTRDVARGEELTLNYYPQLKHLDYEPRTAELRKRGFRCLCPRCAQKK